jgi:hypothetical protein
LPNGLTRILFGRRRPRSPVLRAALDPNETVLAAADLADGGLLAATRFGVWHVDERGPVRWGWDLVSKATFSTGQLRLVVAEVTDTWPDGTVLLTDRPPLDFTLAAKNVLTDVIHQRVRGSVAASRHIENPGGAWVVLRKVAGRNGLTVQVRADPGTDTTSAAFAAAVSAEAARLRGPAID